MKLCDRKNYSHCVLETIPRNADFRTDFYLNFLSEFIAEKVLDKLNHESLQKLSEFAITHAYNGAGNTSVI